MLLVKLVEVVRLQHLISELGEGDALAHIAALGLNHATLHAISAEHRTHTEVLGDVPQESQCVHLAVEVDIVDKLERGQVSRSSFTFLLGILSICIAQFVSQICELCLETSHVPLYRLLVEQVPLR